MTELDARMPGSTKVLGAMFANPCSTGSVSTMAALSAITWRTVEGWYAAAATLSRCVNDAGRPRRSFAFAAANCAGVRVRLILSVTKARTTVACKAGKLPTKREAARAYSALAFVWRTNGSCALAEAAACARSSETRIPMTASPKTGLCTNKGVEGGEGGFLLGSKALSPGQAE